MRIRVLLTLRLLGKMLSNKNTRFVNPLKYVDGALSGINVSDDTDAPNCFSQSQVTRVMSQLLQDVAHAALSYSPDKAIENCIEMGNGDNISSFYHICLYPLDSSSANNATYMRQMFMWNNLICLTSHLPAAGPQRYQYIYIYIYDIRHLIEMCTMSSMINQHWINCL